jgi:hypothetical protein
MSKFSRKNHMSQLPWHMNMPLKGVFGIIYCSIYIIFYQQEKTFYKFLQSFKELQVFGTIMNGFFLWQT